MKEKKNYKNSKKKKRITCKICMTRNFYKIKTSCNHKICLDCLTKLSKPLCPFCRNDLKNELPENIINIINKNLSNLQNYNNTNTIPNTRTAFRQTENNSQFFRNRRSFNIHDLNSQSSQFNISIHGGGEVGTQLLNTALDFGANMLSDWLIE